MGWRLVAALTALAAVACGITVALVALVPDPAMSGAFARPRPRAATPWAACARAVRHQLADASGIEVQGPTRTRWEASGAGVDLSGQTRGGDRKAVAFGCHAVRLGEDWQVERIVFTDR